MSKHLLFLFAAFLTIMLTADIYLHTAQFVERHQPTILTAKKAQRPKIVLITIDGVRWQDMFDATESIGSLHPTSKELMPNIYNYFIDGGIAIGKHSLALTQNPARVSMPGYIEIVSGSPSKSCFDNYCASNSQLTLINQFANNAVVISGWDAISKVFDNSIAAVNIGRHIRSEKWTNLNIPDNINYPDIFEEAEYRADQYTQDAVLSYLKNQPQPDFLWISFGDTDEHAHMGNLLQYWIDLIIIDNYIKDIISLIDTNTVLIICPDHGRNQNNWRDHGDETSSRVWILIAGASIPKAGFISYDRKVYLSDIFPTIMSIAYNVPSEKSLLNYQK